MVTRRLDPKDKSYLTRLGKYVESLILNDMKYRSLDAFALEHHDVVTKPTLYQICAGKRDMKLSTLRRLAGAIGVKASSLLDGIE